MPGRSAFKLFLVAAFALLAGSTAWAAEDGVWSVSKSSGEVWLTTQGAQQVSLGSDNVLKPGDMIRTGRNGRALLTRGAETILIAPNSEVGLPTGTQDGMATTIQQRAGSILLDVEHRDVKHFEVETPYLAAVVKGTQFRVTIDGRSTKVDVSRGQVEVSDFKSGQIAQVMPGQRATSFVSGRPHLDLSGAGTLNPIEQGRPRAPSIQRVPVPRDGLHPPREAKGGVVHAVGPVNTVPLNPSTIQPADHQHRAAATARSAGVRISSALGEVRLNIGKATQGLAHGAAPTSGRDGSRKTTAWGESRTAAAGDANGNSSATAGTDSTSPSTVRASVAAAIGSANASVGLAGSSSTSNTSSSSSSSSGNSSGNGGSSSGNSSSGNSGSNNGGGKGNAYGNLTKDVNIWLTYWAAKAASNGNAYGVGNGNAYGKNKN